MNDPLGWRRLVVVIGLLGLGVSARAPASDEPPDDGSFGFSTPILCREIKGFEDYIPLPRPALSADEKLLVYFRPRHYKSKRDGRNHEIHLTQDGQIRRKGEKPVLWAKKKLLDYQVTTEGPPGPVFLRNTISLKGLRPGEYEYDITLRDEVGQSAPATRSVPFTVLASPPDDTP